MSSKKYTYEVTITFDKIRTECKVSNKDEVYYKKPGTSVYLMDKFFFDEQKLIIHADRCANYASKNILENVSSGISNIKLI